MLLDDVILRQNNKSNDVDEIKKCLNTKIPLKSANSFNKMSMGVIPASIYSKH